MDDEILESLLEQWVFANVNFRGKVSRINTGTSNEQMAAIFQEAIRDIDNGVNVYLVIGSSEEQPKIDLLQQSVLGYIEYAVEFLTKVKISDQDHITVEELARRLGADTNLMKETKVKNAVEALQLKLENRSKPELQAGKRPPVVSGRKRTVK